MHQEKVAGTGRLQTHVEYVRLAGEAQSYTACATIQQRKEGKMGGEREERERGRGRGGKRGAGGRKEKCTADF